MQVTTRIEGNGTSKMVPALGEVWGHACTNRVFLHHKQVLLNYEYITERNRSDESFSSIIIKPSPFSFPFHSIHLYMLIACH
jgi:hypothetical protein